MKNINTNNFTLSDHAIAAIIDVLQFGMLHQVDVTNKLRALQFVISKEDDSKLFVEDHKKLITE